MKDFIDAINEGTAKLSNVQDIQAAKDKMRCLKQLEEIGQKWAEEDAAAHKNIVDLKTAKHFKNKERF